MTNGWLMKSVRATLAKMGFPGRKNEPRPAAEASVRNDTDKKDVGYGHAYREPRAFTGDISRLLVSGLIDLRIIQDGDEPSLTVYCADAEQAAGISTVTRQGEMVVEHNALSGGSTSLGDLSRHGGAIVIESMNIDFSDSGRMTTEVSGVHVIGGKTGEAAGRPPLVELVLPEIPVIHASGASNLDLKAFEQDRVQVVLSGACGLTARGHVAGVDLQMSGASNADTRYLVARRVRLAVSGAATAAVLATEAFEADISGAAKVTVYGHPAERRANTTGVSRVRYEQ